MAFCGLTTSAHAQLFEFLQKAAETTSKVAGAVNEVKSYQQQNNQKPSSPSYTSLGSVTAKRFSGNITSSAHVDIVRTSSGEDKVLKNGNLYSICENYSYNVYCTDPKSSAYYKYYFNSGGAYYFNW